MSTPADKLVVLARGLGTRMRRADAATPLSPRQAAVADAGVKAMMPVGRPFLDYVLSAVAAAGCRRVCLVVGPDHEAIRRYYAEEVQPRRLAIEFAVQPDPKGTADAVLAAEAFAAGEPFLVLNSDNYYPADALRRLRRQDGSAVALFDRETMLPEGNVSAERLQQFAIGEVDNRGFLRRIVEKPDAAAMASLKGPVWVSMNCWRFSEKIFEACRAIGPSPRGELEIPAAVSYAMEMLGESFRVVTCRAAVLDLSRREDVGPVTAGLADVEVDF